VKERIARWSDGTERVLVLLIAFGAAIPRSLHTLLFPSQVFERAAPLINGPHLLATLGYELGIGALLALFLNLRGWTWERLGLQPAWRDLLWGPALLLAAYAAYFVLWNVVLGLWPEFYRVAVNTHLVAAHIPWPILLATSIVNPMFEEVFVCGYVITALKEKTGLAAAINASAGLRLFYHLYQGAVGVVALVPFGLVFAIWFARTGRLWPLILAHALQDLVGLLYGH
jgi:uncharacterized protein